LIKCANWGSRNQCRTCPSDVTMQENARLVVTRIETNERLRGFRKNEIYIYLIDWSCTRCTVKYQQEILCPRREKQRKE
jgi:hypothetical protein